MLRDGKPVAVLDINTSNIEQLKRKYKDRIIYFSCDIAYVELVKELTSEVNQFFGSIDCDIHNACKCIFTDFKKTSRNNFESVYNVNFYGAINLTNAVLPIMKNKSKSKPFLQD